MRMIYTHTDPPYFVLTSSLLIEFLAFHFGVRLIVSLWYGGRYAILKYNYITTTLIISSFGKMLLILMVIWDYTELEHSWHLVNFIVFTSNVEALSGKFFVLKKMEVVGLLGKKKKK